MKIRIAGRLPMSAVNGDGIRYVVFVQGCGHHCQGCQNPDTWDFEGGTEYDTQELADIIAPRLSRKRIYDGLTLSGGDPFYQEDECAELIKILRRYMPDLNVWIYTGFDYEAIRDTELANLANSLVVGPYVEDLKCTDQYYGSSNQRIIRKEVVE